MKQLSLTYPKQIRMGRYYTALIFQKIKLNLCMSVNKRTQCTNHPVPVVMETPVTVQCTHSSNSQDELIQPLLYVVSQATSQFCSSLCIATLKRSNAMFEQQMSTCITTAMWRSPHLCFPMIHLECVPTTWLG